MFTTTDFIKVGLRIVAIVVRRLIDLSIDIQLYDLNGICIFLLETPYCQLEFFSGET